MTPPDRTTTDPDRNAALLDWYGSHGRDLPWRSGGDLYSILVSEVMAQQTQVERVVPYFGRFLEAFPTVDSLATAPLADVLRVWSGLGYNGRARRLHEAADIIVACGWPTDVASLEALPGVGPYTARAIACFGLGREVVPTDTNVRRVLSRWRGEPLDGPVLDAVAASNADGSEAAEWTQAVMDLGATLCRPRSPKCDLCPVAAWCAGPDVYVPPRFQPRFEGSARQLRGAIIRRLVAAPATPEQLATAVGFSPSSVRVALEDLESEGLVEPDGSVFRLPH